MRKGISTITLVILSLFAEKLSVLTFTYWAPVATGAGYDVSLLSPLVGPDLTHRLQQERDLA